LASQDILVAESRAEQARQIISEQHNAGADTPD
jgi:hypothetical protein